MLKSGQINNKAHLLFIERLHSGIHGTQEYYAQQEEYLFGLVAI